jgi:hypothetical protein
MSVDWHYFEMGAQNATEVSKTVKKQSHHASGTDSRLFQPSGNVMGGCNCQKLIIQEIGITIT